MVLTFPWRYWAGSWISSGEVDVKTNDVLEEVKGPKEK